MDDHALKALLSKVKAGEGEDDYWWPDAGLHHKTGLLAQSAYYGSVDAAIELKDAVLPGWSLLVHGGHHGAQDYGAQVQKVHLDNSRSTSTGRAPDPARALLIAILEALIAEGEG